MLIVINHVANYLLFDNLCSNISIHFYQSDQLVSHWYMLTFIIIWQEIVQRYNSAFICLYCFLFHPELIIVTVGVKHDWHDWQQPVPEKNQMKGKLPVDCWLP